MEERRQAPRVSIRKTGLTSGIKHILGSAFGTSRVEQWDKVMDLSTKGACFVTEAKLDALQELPLALRIDAQTPSVELRGTVVRVSAPDSSGRRRVGVQFTDYRGEAWSRLRWFEQHHINEGRPAEEEARGGDGGRRAKDTASDEADRGSKMVQALTTKALQ